MNRPRPTEPMQLVPAGDPWPRIAQGALLCVATAWPAEQLLAAAVAKTLVADGISNSCAGAICRDSVFFGKIDYLDPDDAVAARARAGHLAAGRRRGPGLDPTDARSSQERLRLSVFR